MPVGTLKNLKVEVISQYLNVTINYLSCNFIAREFTRLTVQRKRSVEPGNSVTFKNIRRPTFLLIRGTMKNHFSDNRNFDLSLRNQIQQGRTLTNKGKYTVVTVVLIV